MAKLKSFHEGLDFTRASTKWVFNKDRVLVEVPIDEPAFDHDPLTGDALGCLIEESRTNLLLWNEAFDNAYWNTERATIAPNDISSPSSSITADKLIESTDPGSHFTQRLGVDLSSGDHCWSIFAKAAERNWIAINAYDGTSLFCWFDLSSGNFGSVNGGLSVDSEELPNGWYRLKVKRSLGAATTNGGISIHIADVNGLITYTGDGTSGIYIWGVQLEQGSTASSYIPTTSAAVTRVADNLSRTLGAEYNSSEGEIKLTAKAPVGQTLLTLGSQTIVSDLDDFKEYTLDYASDPSATSLVFGNGQHKILRYYDEDLV